MNRQLRNSLLLTFTALIWGVAFVAQSEGSEHFGSCTFTGIRFLVASAVLLPFILIRDRKGRRERPAGENGKAIWPSGIICGVLLCAASLLQQEGIAQGTSAGKAGFLTAVYIVLVPLLNLLIFKKTTSRTIWIGVILALGGLYLLCINEAFTFRLSDLLVVACALLFAFQILAVDRFSPLYDAIKLAAVQFFTCGALSSLLMIPMDIIPNGFQTWASSFSSPGAWISLSYAAILSSAIGYTFQIMGQKGLNPTVASLLMSLESLFAVLAGWLILHQSLTVRESIGAVLVFAAVIIAQLPTPKTAGSK